MIHSGERRDDVTKDLYNEWEFHVNRLKKRIIQDNIAYLEFESKFMV